MNTKLRLTVLDGEYAIHRLLPEQDIPSSVLKNDFFAITRTGEELSIVCDINTNGITYLNRDEVFNR